MSKNNYNPKPVDTSHVELTDELLKLAELMAENVHEVWSATRIAQGWSYGPVRDDVKKEHPCLVPYEQLPEEEKILDRKSSIETLKFIVLNGFEINSKSK